MKQSSLSRVEDMIRRVMEEPFTWFGSDSLDPYQLATHLARNYDIPANGDLFPNRFIIFISPEDFQILESNIPRLEKQVADYLVLMTGRRGIRLSELPRVHFDVDPKEESNSARIVVSHERESGHVETAIFPVESADPTQAAIREADAYLILQGRQHIPLDRPVTLIGRRIENDIVLDSPSISRYHAQIRWRQRYFVLYDISSHGRTFVNGEPVQEHILRAGDVIALSDILFVYGEGREEIASSPNASDGDEIDSTMLKPDL